MAVITLESHYGDIQKPGTRNGLSLHRVIVIRGCPVQTQKGQFMRGKIPECVFQRLPAPVAGAGRCGDMVGVVADSPSYRASNTRAAAASPGLSPRRSLSNGLHSSGETAIND